MKKDYDYSLSNMNYEKSNNELLNIISNKNSEIQSLENEIFSKNEKILNLKKKNSQFHIQKNNEISKLKKKNKKLNKQKKEILSSTSWKLTSPIRKFKHFSKKILKIFKRNKPKKTSSKNKSKNLNFKRKNIKKNKKLSLNQAYLQKYGVSYLYNVYFISEDLNRINIFFDQIDNSIYELKNLFNFLIEYCNNFDCSIRIIYNNADFFIFNDFLKKFKLTLPNCSFLNLKDDNYIEIGLNEKFVCTSWITARKVLNTNGINSKVYFYLPDLKECTSEEHFQISKICYNEKVIILNDNLDKLNFLRKFNYKFEMNISDLDKKNKVLSCDFENMFFEGFELIKYLYFNKILNFNEWNFVIHSDYEFSKKYLDLYGITIPIYKNVIESDLFLKFDFYNNININQKNYIKIYFEEEIDTNYAVLDITDSKCFDNFDNLIPLKKYHYNSYYIFEEIFNKLNEVQ